MFNKFVVVVVLTIATGLVSYLLISTKSRKLTKIVEDNRADILDIIKQSSSRGEAIDKIHEKYGIKTLHAANIVDEINKTK